MGNHTARGVVYAQGLPGSEQAVGAHAFGDRVTEPDRPLGMARAGQSEPPRSSSMPPIRKWAVDPRQRFLCEIGGAEIQSSRAPADASRPSAKGACRLLRSGPSGGSSMVPDRCSTRSPAWKRRAAGIGSSVDDQADRLAPLEHNLEIGARHGRLGACGGAIAHATSTRKSQDEICMIDAIVVAVSCGWPDATFAPATISPDSRITLPSIVDPFLNLDLSNRQPRRRTDLPKAVAIILNCTRRPTGSKGFLSGDGRVSVACPGGKAVRLYATRAVGPSARHPSDPCRTRRTRRPRRTWPKCSPAGRWPECCGSD